MPRTTNSKYQPSAPSNTMTYVLGGIAVLVIAGLVIGGIWWSGRDQGDTDQAALASSSTMIVGPETAPLIDVFEDPMCPVCKVFEQQSGPAITKAVTEGKLRVRYHTLHFLNSRSATGDYSSRAAGALTCVADEQNTDLFLRFHSALFAAQPPEDGTGNITSPELARLARHGEGEAPRGDIGRLHVRMAVGQAPPARAEGELDHHQLGPFGQHPAGDAVAGVDGRIDPGHGGAHLNWAGSHRDSAGT